MKIYKKVNVFIDDKKIGVLMDTDRGSIFRYDNEWQGENLSWSLERKFSDESARNFFRNLLPEKPRSVWYTQFTKLSFNRLASFLEKHGADLPGNISIGSGQFRDITEKITRLVSRGQPLDDLMLRLSLPGGEPKIAVFMANNRFFSPGKNKPSTHIIKASSLTFFEGWAMAFAKKCEINTVNATIIGLDGREALLVERFDRICVNGIWKKLKQEDFCQQLGFDSSDKYCVAGKGVDAKDMSKIMLERLDTNDIRNFLRMTIFSMMIGNLDDHAKNYAIISDLDGRTRLAPAYDITCVTAIREIGRKALFDGFERYRNIDLHLPRIFGGERLANRIRPSDFTKMGAFFNLDGTEILDIWKENTETIIKNLPDFNEEFKNSEFNLSNERFNIKNRYSDVIKTHIEKRMKTFLRIQETAEKNFSCHHETVSFTPI